MEKKQPNSSEEIDLLYFFRPVSNAFKQATTWGTRYARLLAHNMWLFAAILLLGSAAGYCLRYVISPTYKTDAIFVSDMLPASYCVNLLQNLNELRRPGNVPTLAKELGISTDAAWQIRGISATASGRDTFSLEKRDSSMSVFNVSLVMKDINYIEEVQKGLINYLENNEYVRKRKTARAQGLRVQIAELENRRLSLDTLRVIVRNSIIPRSQGQGIILGQPIDPVTIYQAEASYLKEKIYLEERLSTIDHIEVLQPFFKLQEHNNPNYDKMLKYAFVASFLFGLLVVWLIGRRPKSPVVPVS